MNLTVVLLLTALVAWIVLAFVAAIPAGWVHLCYAAAAMLFAQRVLVGAPRFRS